MQDFIQQHIRSILRPTAEHVIEIQDNTRQLAENFKWMSEQLRESKERLNTHDHALSAVRESHSSISNHVGQLERGVLEAAQKHKALDTEHHSTKSSLSNAHGRLDAVDTSVHTLNGMLEKTDVLAQQLQLKLSQTSKLADRLESELNELKGSHMGLCDRHLNLARGHQHTMQDIEAHGQGLTRATSKMDSHRAEMIHEVAGLNERCGSLEQLLTGLRRDLGVHAESSKAAMSQLSQLTGELSDFQQTLQSVQDGSKSSKNAAASLLQRLSDAELGVASLRREFQAEMEKNVFGQVQELAKQVKVTTATADTNFTDIRSLEGPHKQHTEQIRFIEERLREAEKKGERLNLRLDMSDNQVHGIKGAQRDAAHKINLQALEMERTRGRQMQMHQIMGDQSMNLQHLNSEVGSATANVKNVSARLDLAHEYFDGLGKGFQDAHRHTVAGTGGMLPSKLPQGRLLPELQVTTQGT